MARANAANVKMRDSQKRVYDLSLNYSSNFTVNLSFFKIKRTIDSKKLIIHNNGLLKTHVHYPVIPLLSIQHKRNENIQKFIHEC